MRRPILPLLSTVPLLAAAAVLAGTSPASADSGPQLTVDVTADRHAISKYIYGMNFADEDLAEELHLPVRRWGGNATTRYNYLLDETNRGSDWYFENVPGDADPAQLPDGSETDTFVEQDQRTGTDTILTVPLIGWIPKARDYSCGFSVEKYGEQQDTDAQWRPDCGNGVKPDGTFITGNDPTDTSMPAGADYVTDWLTYLTGKYGTADNGGVKFYNLDNEPDIWHQTHRDVHPQGASYDEMKDSTYRIAAAVKAADPGAKTLGPVGWGWNSLTLSGLDQQTCNAEGGSCWSNPPDKAAHGGVDFGAWYLQQMKAYEDEHGVRILDYYDNHWYPQETGVAFGNAEDPATNELRLRSTRNLWDPTYVDESWINAPTALIPRMKQLVADNYPGTKTAITEYNWGALDSMNGALAQADVLGIFGREGLDLATLWAPPTADQPGAYAFRMYLNYDGAGSTFGDISVHAASTDQDQLAIYAADRSSDGATTMMVINKTGNDLTSSLSLRGRLMYNMVKVYQYTPDDLTSIVHAPDVGLLPAPSPGDGPPLSGLRMTFPANSITELVATPSSAPVDTVAPTQPGTPTASDITSSSIHLAWAPSTDNVGVTGYDVIQVYEDTLRIVASTAVNSVAIDGLDPDRDYTFRVMAKDAAGNTSAMSGQITVTTLDDGGGGQCTATYTIVNQWPGGFQGDVTVHNPGDTPLSGWSVGWSFGAGQQVTQLWNGTLDQQGDDVTVANAAWNATIAPGGSQEFGFLGSWDGTNPIPTVTCSSG